MHTERSQNNGEGGERGIGSNLLNFREFKYNLSYNFFYS